MNDVAETRASALDNTVAPSHIFRMIKTISGFFILLLVVTNAFAQQTQTNATISTLAELQSRLAAQMSEPRFAAAA